MRLLEAIDIIKEGKHEITHKYWKPDHILCIGADEELVKLEISTGRIMYSFKLPLTGYALMPECPLEYVYKWTYLYCGEWLVSDKYYPTEEDFYNSISPNIFSTHWRLATSTEKIEASKITRGEIK